MITKLLEIRDRATFIPALAIQFDSENEAERYLVASAGYGQTREAQRGYIALYRIDGETGQITTSSYAWKGPRTMHIAHKYIQEHWPEINSGDVIDVEHILDESKAMKMPERLERYP